MKTFIVVLSALALVLSSATSVRAQEKEGRCRRGIPDQGGARASPRQSRSSSTR